MAAAANPFQKATKAQLKARVAFEGPTGAGKTWTGLQWATVLAGDNGRIAFVDTERGSAALYADHFDFDVLAFEPPYEPGRLVDLLKVAEQQGYAVVVIDSLSHFWEGEGGTLDMVDAAAAASRSGNKFSEGWKVATPALRHLVDTMLGLDAHLVVTMRSKMEHILVENERGQKVPTKVGMAPVMRAGVEYEFTLVGDLDLTHRLLISKSRCDVLADAMIQPGRAAEGAEKFLAWLNTGEPMISPADAEALVERLNALPGPARTAYRERQFPAPRALRESQLPEVLAFLADLEAGPDDTDPAGAPVPSDPPSDDGGGEASGPDGRGVAGGDTRETEQGAGQTADHDGKAAHEEAQVLSGPQVDLPAPAPPAPDVLAPEQGGEEAGAGGSDPEGGATAAPATALDVAAFAGSAAPRSEGVDVQDLVDLVKDRTGFKKAGAREGKLLAKAREIGANLQVDPLPTMFSDLAPGPLLDETYHYFELLAAAEAHNAAETSGGGDGTHPELAAATPTGAAHQQTAAQKALHARLADKYPQRTRQDQARHALIAQVTGGRTESSAQAAPGELVEALRLVDECDDPQGGWELHLNANGAVVLRKRALKGRAA